MIRQFFFRQLLIPVQDGSQILIPAVIFPLEKSQKDLFLCLKVVINGGTGEGCDIPESSYKWWDGRRM